QFDGKTITRHDGRSVTLKLKNQRIVNLPMSERQKFLRTITNPSLAYFLLIFGLIGLYIEFTHPGVAIPGILGGISLLLAFLAFQILPINYVGLFLILLSIGFFVAEIKVQGFGVLGVGGIISFILGSMMLINSPIPEMRPAMSLIISFAVCFGFVFLFLTFKVFQAMKRKLETGREGLIGERGVAKTDIDNHSGKAFVHGEWWNAVADGLIPAGTAIQVEAVNNLLLKVKKTGG
ncbi:MAG TPA: NfeD family protein, partial [Candidatus Binatia bacterium]|nr:NfeD family protein [Candidatus Binatia bacterium]